MLLTLLSCATVPTPPQPAEPAPLGPQVEATMGGSVVVLGQMRLEALEACPGGGLAAAGKGWDGEYLLSVWSPEGGVVSTPLETDGRGVNALACLQDGSVVVATRTGTHRPTAFVFRWWPGGELRREVLTLGNLGEVSHLVPLGSEGYVLGGDVSDTEGLSFPSGSGVFLAFYGLDGELDSVRTLAGPVRAAAHADPLGHELVAVDVEGDSLRVWVNLDQFRHIRVAVPLGAGRARETFRITPEDGGRAPGLYGVQLAVRSEVVVGERSVLHGTGPMGHRLLELEGATVVHQLPRDDARDTTSVFGLLPDRGGVLVWGSVLLDADRVFHQEGHSGDYWIGRFEDGALVPLYAPVFRVGHLSTVQEGGAPVIGGHLWSGDAPLEIAGQVIEAPPGEYRPLALAWIDPFGG